MCLFVIIYGSEIQDILTFCITTAEQSLLETSPQMAGKLQEGRIKRVKMCEKAYQVRRKDLEQRSVETCVVSSSALAGFQEKAAKKLSEAEAEMKKAMNVFCDMLQKPVQT